MRPDILARRGGNELLVEVAVTHFCGGVKVARICERGLAAIEIDLSRLPQDAGREDVEAAILRTAPRAWLYNRLAEAALRDMAAAAERREELRRLRREQAFNSLVHALEEAVRVPSTACAPADDWKLARAREAGLGGMVGLAIAGDGCFRVVAEHWQSACLVQFLIGRAMPFGDEEIGTFLKRSRMLKPPFDDELLRGFTWAEVGARCPGLVAPIAVVGEYLKALGAMGLVRHGRGGLWAPSRRVLAPPMGSSLAQPAVCATPPR